MHGQAKRPQAEIWGRHGVPDPGWGPGRSGTPIKLKIRVLIRESWCPNLDSPTQRKPAGSCRRARESGPEPALISSTVTLGSPLVSPGWRGAHAG
jgi:hypothetical protein